MAKYEATQKRVIDTHEITGIRGWGDEKNLAIVDLIWLVQREHGRNIG